MIPSEENIVFTTPAWNITFLLHLSSLSQEIKNVKHLSLCHSKCDLQACISLRSPKTVFIHVDQRMILEVTLMNCCLTSIIMDNICVYSAQAQGLLCEEAGNYGDNVKYCGYCVHHYKKLVRRATHRTMTVLTENTLVSLGLDSRYCRIYLTL